MQPRTLLFFLLICTALSAQTPEASRHASDQHTHEGIISSGIYSNEFFEFSVEVPAGWKVADNSRYQALNQKAREDAAKMSPELAKLGEVEETNSPLLVMGEMKPWMDTKQHRLVRILSSDVNSQSRQPSPEEFLKFLADSNRRYGLSEVYVTKPEAVKLGGRTAWKAYFNQQGSILWRSVNVVVVSKKHILQFILTSPDEQGLRSLETVLRTVRFKD